MRTVYRFLPSVGAPEAPDAIPSGTPHGSAAEVIKQRVSRSTELESGGRIIDAILTTTVLPGISPEFLTRMMEGKPVERVHVKVENGEFGYEFER